MTIVVANLTIYSNNFSLYWNGNFTKTLSDSTLSTTTESHGPPLADVRQSYQDLVPVEIRFYFILFKINRYIQGNY